MWSIMISLAIYYVASYKLGRVLGEYGIEKGLAKTMLVGIGAMAVAYSAGWAVDAAFPSQAINLMSMTQPQDPRDAKAGAAAPSEAKQLEDALNALQK